MSRLLVGMVAVALGSLLGSDAFGARSTVQPFNGRIAFAAVGGIASMNPDGSGQWGVELNVGDSTPAWSPDGSQLAVVTHWAGNYGILLMNPDGSGAHLVTTDSGDRDPAWSPDGTQIAFANGAAIWAVNTYGGGRKQLTTGTYGSASRPAWSPDGSKLAFAAYEDGKYGTSEIYVLDRSSGKETALTGATLRAVSPAWSPDGGTIAFSSDGVIYVMNADGTGVHALTNGAAYADVPAWSPDGTQIAFAQGSQIWVMARDGSGQRQLTAGDWNTSPAWQPLPPAPLGCTLWGTAANDLLVGTEGNDVICGLGGDDTLIGLGGHDMLFGGDGSDYLAGGLGFDELYGGAGDDTLDARDGGPDVVLGSLGIDTANVDAGRMDTMAGIERPHVDRNLAAWRPTTADAAEPTNPPVRAVDGRIDDWWNSGGYPSHWVEVDLQQPRDVADLHLVCPDLPIGATIAVLGRASTTEPFRLLHVFAGPTFDLQLVDFAPKHPWHAIRYVRVLVPASNTAGLPWISMREIEVYGPTPARKKRVTHS